MYNLDIDDISYSKERFDVEFEDFIPDIKQNYYKNEDKTVKIQGDKLLSEHVRDTITLSLQSVNERLNNLEEKNTKSEKELFYSSLIDEIKFQLTQALLSQSNNKKIDYLQSAKSYSNRLFKELENAYSTISQAILVINDCILFNELTLVLDNGLTILLEIISELKVGSLTQEKLELYIEKLYEKKLKLFGGNDCVNDLKDFLPDEYKNLFDDLG